MTSRKERVVLLWHYTDRCKTAILVWKWSVLSLLRVTSFMDGLYQILYLRVTPSSSSSFDSKSWSLWRLTNACKNVLLKLNSEGLKSFNIPFSGIWQSIINYKANNSTPLCYLKNADSWIICVWTYQKGPPLIQLEVWVEYLYFRQKPFIKFSQCISNAMCFNHIAIQP